MDEGEAAYRLLSEKREGQKLTLEKLAQIATDHFLRNDDHEPMVVIEDDRDQITIIGMDSIPEDRAGQIVAFYGAALLARPHHARARIITYAIVYKAYMASLDVLGDNISDNAIREKGKHVLFLIFYDVQSQQVTRQLHEILHIGQTLDLRLWKTFRNTYPDERVADSYLESVILGVKQ